MANLADVMDELGAAVAIIDGIRAYPYTSESISPPAVSIGWPEEYNFDKTMRRGSDQVIMPVTVIVGRADARSSRDRLAKYAAGSGVDSVKEAIELWPAVTWDSARVTKVEFIELVIASTPMLAAMFDVELYVKGQV